MELEGDFIGNFYQFVDDTIAVLKKTRISGFLEHQNNQNGDINFTIERYEEKVIAFLDLKNIILEDGSICTKAYSKQTHSGRYLLFSSHHPIQHKSAVATSLFNY